MTIPLWLIIVAWFTFAFYWGVSSFGVKRDTTGRWSWWWSGKGFAIRVIASLVIIAAVLLRLAIMNHALTFASLTRPGSPHADAGAIICWAGVLVAIWARRHLGKNWSGHPTLKEDPELVTSGPYRWVRHPIYSGILLAQIGTALAFGPAWFLILIVTGAIFVRRVFIEEAIMETQFPGQYREYEKRTKALVPFVW